MAFSTLLYSIENRYKQIRHYLDSAGKELESVKLLLSEDTVLQELAKSPLNLSIITLAYRGKKVEELYQTGSIKERRKHLFDAYIERLFQRKVAKQKYTRHQVKHWLRWLAQKMSQTSQTVFLIEQIQSTWLPKDSQRFTFAVGVNMTVGLTAAFFHVGPLCSVFKGCHGLVEGLIGGVIVGLLYGSLGGVIYKRLSENLARLTTSLSLGLLFGLVFWLVLGLTFGITYSIFYLLCGLIVYDFCNKEIKPINTLKWSPQKALKNLGFALIFILILSVTNGPLLGMIFGVFLWLILSWEKRTEIDRTTRPNQGVWKSVQDTIKVTVIIGLFSGIVLWILQAQYELILDVDSWVFGLANGVMFAYGGALLSTQGAGFLCFKHLILRFLLWRSGCIPWNYSRFLDYAAKRIFLQKVGGGYIFVHRMLLEHFAQMK